MLRLPALPAARGGAVGGWGIELEIVALDLDDAAVVIHVMPTALRRP